MVALGEFLHFAVRIDFVAFSEIAHTLNPRHELLFLVVVVCLGKYVDDLFGKV